MSQPLITSRRGTEWAQILVPGAHSPAGEGWQYEAVWLRVVPAQTLRDVGPGEVALLQEAALPCDPLCDSAKRGSQGFKDFLPRDRGARRPSLRA